MAHASTSMASPIPLFCIVCPSTPSFSDVSHLLTHVSSKSHLAHQFKLQVRTSKEEAAQEKLDHYQYWYDFYGIGDLLSERMSAKEEKAAKAKAKAKAKVTTGKPQSAPKKEETPAPKDLSAKTTRNSDRDIQEIFSCGLLQQDDEYGSDLFVQSQSPEANATDGPSLGLWPTALDKLHAQPKIVSSSFRSRLDPDLTRCNYSYSIAGMNHPLDQFIDYDPEQLPAPRSPSAPIADTPESGALDFEQTTDGLKVKGVYWPGMGLFDSATPEQKRTRNQKKDGTVLAQMEINSAEVEPNELIFKDNFDFKKERRITGPDDDRSGVDEHSPRPKRRLTRPKRTALADKSTNLTVLPKAKPRRTRRDDRGPKEEDNKPRMTAQAVVNQLMAAQSTREESRFLPTAEEDEEFRITVSGLAQKKTAFNVFRDPEKEDHLTGSLKEMATMTNPYKPSYGLQNFGSPLGLLFPNQEQPSSLQYPPSPDDPQQKYITSFFRPLASRSSEDKENVEPTLNRFGEIDMDAAQTTSERSTQRYFSVSGAHPPQFFHILPPGMDFGGLHGPDMSGFSSNPLIHNYHHQQFPRAQFASVSKQNYSPPRMHRHGLSKQTYDSEKGAARGCLIRDDPFDDTDELEPIIGARD